MNCDEFRRWLENRDPSDRLESDRALKHGASCDGCRRLLALDELLDQVIARGLKPEKLPEHLESMVAINLGTGAGGSPRYSTALLRTVSAFAGLCAVLLVLYLLPTGSPAPDDFGRALIRDHGMHDYRSDFEPVDDLAGWLAARTGFRAALPRALADRDLALVGGRICVIDQWNTVHLAYRGTAGIVSLYIIEAGEVPASLEEGRTYTVSDRGRGVRLWHEGRWVFAVVD